MKALLDLLGIAAITISTFSVVIGLPLLTAVLIKCALT